MTPGRTSEAERSGTQTKPLRCFLRASRAIPGRAAQQARGGEVREWPIRAVSKTVVPKGTVGSNPTLSARTWRDRSRWFTSGQAVTRQQYQQVAAVNHWKRCRSATSFKNKNGPQPCSGKSGMARGMRWRVRGVGTSARRRRAKQGLAPSVGARAKHRRATSNAHPLRHPQLAETASRSVALGERRTPQMATFSFCSSIFIYISLPIQF